MASLVFGSTVRRVLASGPDPLLLRIEDFNGGFLGQPESTDVAGFEACPDGWCLPPGAAGTLTYRLEPGPQDTRFVQTSVWL